MIPNDRLSHVLTWHHRLLHGNLILTPHIAGNTSDSLAKAEAFIAAKARRMWEEIPKAAP